MIQLILNLEPSKYKHRGHQIYRSIVPGGSVWAFEHEGSYFVTASLFAAKQEINRMVNQ